MAQDDKVKLTIPVRGGVSIDNWTTYSYAQNIMTPVDIWSFSIGDSAIPIGLASEILPGQRVTLSVNGITQGDGLIDEVEYEQSRDGGTQLRVAGRGPLADAVDSNIDPKRKFNASDTLERVAKDTLGDFGFTKFFVDNDATRSIQQGNAYGTKFTKGGKKGGGKPLKSFTMHQSKPFDHEGAYAFIERIAKQFGLHVWCGSDFETIIISTPNFEQEASYRLIRRRGAANGAGNNILSGTLKKSRAEQPSMIIVTGRGAGGANAASTSKVIIINELVSRGTDGEYVPAVKKILEKEKGAHVVDTYDAQRQYFRPVDINPYPVARPVYLADEESQDQAQVIRFAKRALAERQQKYLSASYTVQGHTYEREDGTVVPWAIDTVAAVDDEIANFHGDMYIAGRTFNKSRGGGTTTGLTMILPGTLVF